MDYFYWVCATGNSFPDQSEQSKICIIKELRNNNVSHPKCFSLGYLNINSIRNKFSSILHLRDNNLGIFAIAETKLDSSFPESQFILPGMRKPFWLDVTSRKGGLLVFVNNDIPSKYLRSFHLPGDKAKAAQATCCFYISTSRSKLRLFFVIHYRLTTLSLHGNFNANESNPAMETF